MAVISSTHNFNGHYNANTFSLTDGQEVGLQFDVNGNLKTAGSGAADNATYTNGTTTGNLVQGVYQTTPDTVTNNKTHAIEIDANANVKVTEATLLAGENLTTNRLNVEPIYSFSNISTATTTTVKSGAGTLHTVIIFNVGATSNTVKIYDNTAASGTVIADWSTSGGAPVAGQYTFDVSFSTGLTVVTAGTTSPNLTVTYR